MTVTDLFDRAEAGKPRAPAAKPSETAPERVQARRAHVRAIVEAPPAISKTSGRAARIRSTVASDWHNAWLWDAQGLTVRGLWEDRIPDLDQTAAGNAALRAAWITYNHVALLILVPLLFAAWVLGHPARLLYATPLAALIPAIWLF